VTIHERTSVLIPAFGEESSIASLVESVRSVGPFQEILVIDDGSTDRTAEMAKAAGATVIRHPYNKGNGAAVKTAVRAAQGEFIVLLDGDGQHPPEDIPRLTEKLEDYDLVVGARSFKSQASLSRGLGNGALNRFGAFVSGFPVQDLTSGFRAARRDRFREFLHLYPNGFSYPTTSTLAFVKAGYNVAFVPIEGKTRPKNSKSKMRPWREGWRFLAIVLRMVTLFSPLRIFAPVSLLFFVLGAGYMGYTLWDERDVTDVSVLLLTASAVLFLFGLLSEQIAALRFVSRDE
jgi:glycosyltransferase involved in cell wall biosynthesis